MRVVIQRVTSASVTIDGIKKSEISQGLLILLGIENNDTEEDISWLSKKIVNLRIFNDENNVMNCSVKDVNGDMLVVTHFTVHTSTKEGKRPSYIRAVKPHTAIPDYEKFVQLLETESGKSVQPGEFGADMKVALLNDGPVTILIDTKNKE